MSPWQRQCLGVIETRYIGCISLSPTLERNPAHRNAPSSTYTIQDFSFMNMIVFADLRGSEVFFSSY